VRVKRHFLRERDGRKLLGDFCGELGVNVERLFPGKPRVEVVESGSTRFFLVDGKPLIVEVGGRLIPTLVFSEAVGFLPRVVVDMGAVPHVANGADVMAPGVVRVEGAPMEGDLVAVVDERHGKAIAVGVAIVSAEAIPSTKRGKVVKNLHYVGDKIWRLIKSLE